VTILYSFFFNARNIHLTVNFIRCIIVLKIKLNLHLNLNEFSNDNLYVKNNNTTQPREKCIIFSIFKTVNEINE